VVLPPALARTLRPALAVGVLVLVVSRVGTGPFREALTHTTAAAVVLALVVESAVTACCARRWVVVARALGLPLEPRTALAACFRSQLLNVTLPGGVLGDVHRAWRHGEAVDARGPAARAVLWERTIGFAALVVVGALVVLAVPGALPSPARWWALVALGAVAAAGLALGLVVRRRPEALGRAGVLVAEGRSLWRSGALATAGALSVTAVAGHLLVLVAALRAVGVDVGATAALPLLAAVLLASTVPANLAGWGPREGAAAVLFGAAGLGAATGVTVAATYGVLTFVAALPGVAVLVRRAAPAVAPVPVPVPVREEVIT
jgi:glycosyltransferase 2 family protein